MSSPPPADGFAEQTILGSLLWGSLSLDDAPNLHAELFWENRHRRIFEAIEAIHLAGRPVDATSVQSALRLSGRLAEVGGADWVEGLVKHVPVHTKTRLEAWVQTLENRHKLRELLKVGQKIVAIAETGAKDVDGFAFACEAALHAICASGRVDSTITLRDAVSRAVKAIMARPGGLAGTPTGFDALDAVLGGLHGGDLSVVAGRPSMGKSALVQAVAANVVRSGKGAILFSLEMPADQLAMRALCAEAGVNLGKVRTGQLTPQDWTELTAATKGLCGTQNFLLDDLGGARLADIRSRALRVQREMRSRGVELGLVAIDYLQLMGHAKTDHREQAISEISRGLKGFAKEIQLPVIALSQLNRQVEARADRRPLLSDLRESGAIEQDADNVWLLYRDEYYNAGSTETGVCEVSIPKQRNGPTGTVKIGFHPPTATFKNLDPTALGAGDGERSLSSSDGRMTAGGSGTLGPVRTAVAKVRSRWGPSR